MKISKSLAVVVGAFVGAFASVSVQAQTYLTNGLVAYYPFNGNANDESGKGNDGTVNGATLTTDRFGFPNRAYSVGTNKWIQASPGNLVGTNPLTISLWFRTERVPTHPEILISKGQNNFEAAIGPDLVKGGNDPTRMEWLPKSFIDGNWLTPPQTYSLGVWHHFVGVYDPQNSAVKVFVDGAAQQLTGLATTPIVDDNTETLFFGWRGGTRTFPFTGLLDDVRIYSRALSDQEIGQLYAYEAPPKPSLADGLVAYYPFNGNANDESGNGNDGMVNGAVLGTDRRGQSGSAYVFNGHGGYIEAPQSASLDITGDLTLCAWVMPGSNLPNSGVITYGTIEETNGAYETYGIAMFGTGSLAFDFQSNWPVLELTVGSDSFLRQGEWYHLVTAYTAADGNVRLFANGDKVAEAALGITQLNLGANRVLRIGDNQPGGQEWFNGGIDDVRIYNRALSDDEVSALYRSEAVSITHRATANGQVVNGFVVGITVTGPGYGYTNDPPPAVRIKAAAGSGAQAHAVVTNGVVQQVIIDDPGKGYTNGVRVVIAPPPFSPSLMVAVSRVSVTMSVVLGRKYALDVSTDLQTWSPVGAAFMAEDDTVTQEFEVTEGGRFFRIQEVP